MILARTLYESLYTFAPQNCRYFQEIMYSKPLPHFTHGENEAQSQENTTW